MDTKLVIAIASPFITTILGFILTKVFQNKSKLIAYYGYVSEHKVRPPAGEDNAKKEIPVHTHAIVIRNIGNLPAKNVKISHNILPDYHISQNVEYTVSDLPDGGKEIRFPTLVAKEFITISYLYFPPLTYRGIQTSVKSDEGFAKIIDVIPAAILAPWQKGLMYILLFIGCSTVIYWLGIAFVFLFGIAS